MRITINLLRVTVLGAAAVALCLESLNHEQAAEPDDLDFARGVPMTTPRKTVQPLYSAVLIRLGWTPNATMMTM